MKLNDDIPFDFGGFSNFYDTSLIDNKIMQSLTEGGDELMDYFIQNHTYKSKTSMPLLSFVGAMYPSNFEDEGVEGIDWLVTQIEHNLEKKYEEIKTRESELKAAAEAAAAFRNLNWKERDKGRDEWRRGGDSRYHRGNSRDRDNYRNRERERSKDKERAKERDRDREKERER